MKALSKGYITSSTTIRITSTMITQSYIPAPAAIPMHAEVNRPAAVVSPVTCWCPEERIVPAARKPMPLMTCAE